MPTPILKINVDDEAFKRYKAVFDKYQKQVAEQPDLWKDISEAMGVASSVGVEAANAVGRNTEETRKLAVEEAKREETLKKYAKEHADRDKEAATREKEAAVRRKAALEQTREYGRTVANAAVSLGRLGAGGGGGSGSHIGSFLSSGAGMLAEGGSAVGLGAAGILGGVAAAFGGTYLVGKDVAARYRTAQGYGVSMGEMQGYDLNLGRYLDVEGTLGRLAYMQNDPASMGLFAMMGVDPKGKTAAQLMGETALSAQRMYKANPMVAQQLLGSLYDPATLRRLGQAEPGDVQSAIIKSKQFAATSGVNEDTGKKMTDYVITMDTAADKVKNVFINGLTNLEPPLNKTVEGFSRLADDLKTADGRKKIIDGVSKTGGNVLSNVGSFFSRLVHLGEHGHMGQVSPKGALGASQILPSTARDMARLAGVPFDAKRLNTDESYNLMLGNAYAGYLLKRYGGDETLASAAYNAGPGRVDHWLSEFGDPRKGKISDADWAKHIPMHETNAYVARMMKTSKSASAAGFDVNVQVNVTPKKKAPSTPQIALGVSGG